MSGRIGVFVLGAHRSGTSALASVLAGLSLELGFVPVERNKENEEGYYEHPGFRRLNDRLMAACGGTWDNWALTADDVAARLGALQKDFAAAAADLLAAIPGEGPFVLKDPRAVATWPFWQDVAARAGLDVRIVLILRDPAEVAQSQVTRAADWPTRDAGLTTLEPVHAQWTIGMHRLLTRLPPDGATLVLHRDLMADPARVAGGLARALRLPQDGLPDRIAAAAARIRPALHRARAGTRGHAPATPWEGMSSRLFQALAALPSPGHLSAAEGARIAALLPELPALLPLFNAVRESHGSLRAEVTRLAAALAKAERDLATRPAADPGLDGIRAALDSLAGGQLGEVVRLTLIRASLAESMGNLPETERLLRRATDILPTHSDSWKRLTDLLIRQGRTEEAEKLRQQARARFPDLPAFAPPR